MNDLVLRIRCASSDRLGDDFGMQRTDPIDLGLDLVAGTKIKIAGRSHACRRPRRDYAAPLGLLYMIR
jgi:hypothetical protein